MSFVRFISADIARVSVTYLFVARTRKNVKIAIANADASCMAADQDQLAMAATMDSPDYRKANAESSPRSHPVSLPSAA